MFIVTDFLDVKRQEITDRLKELAPMVDEYRRLEAAASALADVGASSVSTTAAPAAALRRRGPGRPKGSGKRSTAVAVPAAAAETAVAAETAPAERKKVGRPRGSGKKVCRPPGSGKKVGRPPGSGKKVGRPPGSGKKVGRPAGTGKKVGRPPGSGKKVGRPAGKVGRPAGKVGRRKGSGTRAAQAVAFVQGQPGITIPELAAKMGIKQNYLYRVLPSLEQEGKLEKKGRGWHPKG
jgi:hypothetical protein